MAADLALLMSGPRMIDTLTDLRTGSVQPREFLHVVAQMATMLHESQNNLAMLEQRLGEALPGKTQAHPP